MAKPFAFSSFLPIEPTEDQILSLHLQRSLPEVSDWVTLPDVMRDGLPRQQCHDLVEARCARAGWDPAMAAKTAYTIATLIPLADSVDEADAAIEATAAWLTALATDNLHAKIVEIKEVAAETDIHARDPSEMDEEALAAWNAAIDLFDEFQDKGELTLLLGGHEIVITVETDCMMVICQTTPTASDYTILYSFSNVTRDGDDDEGDGGPEDDPDPQPDPTRPELQLA